MLLERLLAVPLVLTAGCGFCAHLGVKFAISRNVIDSVDYLQGVSTATQALWCM